jgi:beta-1,4-mannosyltransferase
MLLLADELSRQVQVMTFSWRNALLGRYDVLHLHWPEAVVARRSALRRWLASLALMLVLLRAKVRRVAVVRTLHNVEPHERQAGPVRAVLWLADRWTTWWILLNRHTTTPRPGPSSVIPLGDYGTWYGDPRPCVEDGPVVAIGQIRAYKNLDQLVRAARGVPGCALVVAGAVSDQRLEAELLSAADGDARIDLRFGHVADADLAELIASSRLVALPYRRMHNSGAALLALTLGRPVLVPDNAVTADLADEVGDGWVHRFTGELAPEDLDAAMAARCPDRGPDLSARAWETIGDCHVEVFLAAARVLRGEPPRDPRCGFVR